MLIWQHRNTFCIHHFSKCHIFGLCNVSLFFEKSNLVELKVYIMKLIKKVISGKIINLLFAYLLRCTVV